MNKQDGEKKSVGRKKNLETKDLKFIVKSYVQENPDVLKIKLTELHKHGLLLGYSKVTRRSFERDTEVNAIIKKTNEILLNSPKLINKNKLKDFSLVELDVHSILGRVSSTENRDYVKNVLEIFKANTGYLLRDFRIAEKEILELKEEIAVLNNKLVDALNKNENLAKRVERLRMENDKLVIRFKSEERRKADKLDSIRYLSEKNLIPNIALEDVQTLLIQLHGIDKDQEVINNTAKKYFKDMANLSEDEFYFEVAESNLANVENFRSDYSETEYQEIVKKRNEDIEVLLKETSDDSLPDLSKLF